MLNAPSVRINRMVIRPSGTFNRQFRRSYKTDLLAPDAANIVESLRGSSVFQPGHFAGIATGFLTPSATPESQIDIVNGWDTKRLSFFMESEYHFGAGSVITEYITGYTDHPGISASGHYDQNMEFHINNIIQVRHSEVRDDNMGMMNLVSLQNASHVFADQNWNGRNPNEHDTRMRPIDIYAAMESSHLGGLGNYADLRTKQTSELVKARRTNASASNFLAEVFDNYRQAQSQAVDGDNTQHILNRARTMVREAPAPTDPFLKAIAQVRSMPIGKIFTYGDLMTLTQGAVKHATVYVQPSQNVVARTHQAGMTADWHGADRHTQVATILSQAVPGLMLDQMLSRLSVSITNHSINGRVQSVVANADTLATGIDFTQNVMNVVSRIEHELIPDISANGTIGFSVQLTVDIFGETWIKVDMFGESYDYVVPSFCDSLLTPLLTGNVNQAMQVADDLNNLYGTITSELSAVVGNNAPAPSISSFVQGFAPAPAPQVQANPSGFGQF